MLSFFVEVEGFLELTEEELFFLLEAEEVTVGEVFLGFEEGAELFVFWDEVSKDSDLV